jgi:hypothetical protein
MSFSFVSTKELAEFKYENKVISYWNINKIAYDEDLFNLYDFELFLTRVKNNFDCIFQKNNQLFFKYINNTFTICPIQLDIKMNEQNKKELIEILENIYNWTQSLLIEKALVDNNL